MRSHTLSKLEIEGREKVLQAEPGFDFYGIRKARSAIIDFGHEQGDSQKPSLTLTADYETESKTYILTIRFEGIYELVLPEMQPILRFAELEVEDVRGRMLEGVRFEVVSHYDSSFRCLCRSIVIVSFEAES